MTSFELTEEQKMMREAVGAFASDEIRPAARPADEDGAIPAALLAKGWELGLVRGAIPEQFGGYGDARSAVSGAVVAEELAWGDLSIAIHLLAPRLLAFPVLEMGTPEQRQRLLPSFGGDRFAAGSAALMEPRYDFDVTDLAVTARISSGGFSLSGTKCLVPLAREAETLLVYARSSEGAGYQGVQAYLVEGAAPGATISEREKTMGLKGLATYRVALDDCRVGAEARLGGERGINFARLTGQARVALSAMAVGVARAAFDYARDYARERKAFGVPIATKQAIAFMLADMAIEIDASRLLVWDAAAHLDKGEDALKESYLAKNYAAAAVVKVTDNAVQVLGGHGYIREHPVEMWLRNGRGFSSFEGLATV